MNAQLLIRWVHKQGNGGVYDILPLGLKVINKISDIVRDEMNKIGGIEMKTSVLQNKEVWKNPAVGMMTWWIIGLRLN